MSDPSGKSKSTVIELDTVDIGGDPVANPSTSEREVPKGPGEKMSKKQELITKIKRSWTPPQA